MRLNTKRDTIINNKVKVTALTNLVFAKKDFNIGENISIKNLAVITEDIIAINLCPSNPPVKKVTKKSEGIRKSFFRKRYKTPIKLAEVNITVSCFASK